MKAALSVAFIILLAAPPAFAQQNVPQVDDARGYFTADGGLALFSNIAGFGTAGSQASSDAKLDLGIHLNRYVLVFGEGGWLRNLQNGVQSMLVSTTTSIYSNHGISLTGGGNLAAWYGLGGGGVTGPVLGRWTPYVVGGIGLARLDPSLHFTYNSGAFAGQTAAPAVGSDVTATLASVGYFTAPASSTERMLMLGGGMQLAITPRWIADGQYRHLWIAAAPVLTSDAITADAITLGLGVRF